MLVVDFTDDLDIAAELNFGPDDSVGDDSATEWDA